MARKKKPPPSGAPEWMVTFGDMMSLLLCFFVIIVSMSELKQDQRFQRVMESIKRTFGFKTSIGMAPGPLVPTNTMTPELIELIIRKLEMNKGTNDDKAIEGDHPSVTQIRDGLEFTMGGRISFETGKARLLDPAKGYLDIFVEGTIGENTKIRVRGHTARKPAAQYHPFMSLDELSFSRGMAIKDYLVSKGIREERITVEAVADNEPIADQAYDETDLAKNRRVSIIVTENLVEAYRGQTKTNQGELLDGR